MTDEYASSYQKLSCEMPAVYTTVARIIMAIHPQRILLSKSAVVVLFIIFSLCDAVYGARYSLASLNPLGAFRQWRSAVHDAPLSQLSCLPFPPNGLWLTPLRNSSPPKKWVMIAPGGGAAWPLPLSSYYFNKNYKIAFFDEPWARPSAHPAGAPALAPALAKRG
jgi:hypothetical protein